MLCCRYMYRIQNYLFFFEFCDDVSWRLKEQKISSQFFDCHSITSPLSTVTEANWHGNVLTVTSSHPVFRLCFHARSSPIFFHPCACLTAEYTIYCVSREFFFPLFFSKFVFKKPVECHEIRKSVVSKPSKLTKLQDLTVTCFVTK